MRVLGVLAGVFASGALANSFDMAIGAWLAANVALSIVGYILGRHVEAVEKTAAELGYIATLPYGLALGHVKLGDLAHVEVPDAPPADMGGES